MRPIDELLKKKREAVRLRLSGLSLAQVKVKTGLSVPTIIKAVEVFKALGWKGLEPETRGRKLSLEVSSQQDESEILAVMAKASQQWQRFCSLEDLLVVYGKSHKAISKKTLMRRLARIVPERDHSGVFARMERFVSKALKETSWLRSRFLVLGFYPVSNGCVFYTLDRRGERRFRFFSGALSESALVEQLALLVPEASPEKPFFVVIKTDSLTRYKQLAAWQKASEARCFLFAQWALPD